MYKKTQHRPPQPPSQAFGLGKWPQAKIPDSNSRLRSASKTCMKILNPSWKSYVCSQNQTTQFVFASLNKNHGYVSFL